MLNLGTSWEWERDPVPIVPHGAGWPPGPMWMGMQRRKPLVSMGFQTSNNPAHGKALYRLWYLRPTLLSVTIRQPMYLQHSGMFMQPLLQWRRSKDCISWVCVYSLRYPSYNVHAPYCHQCPVQIYNIFPHYLINGTIFEKSYCI
jgi:hypothetical protein